MTPSTDGLRERKKRQTRQRIHQAATELFVARGFDEVTIAEVAEAAEVSVNTLYNYIEAKEDLVLPRDQEFAQRLADFVMERAPGESAARAVLGRLRDEVHRRDPSLGLTEGFARVYAMMRAAPTLTARLEQLGQRMTAALAVVLAEETGAAPDAPLPRVVATQLGSLHALVYSEIGRLISAGQHPDAIAEAVLALLDAAEEILGEPILTYATRDTREE
ncbi:TetR/AcrR family transcriptional regulator [Streptomyces sp. 8K308]|uniref:TetR/AcrR family transcriptional regulator n=1 Tax=Streptomyces sp. 8K308 TaxID=2530388 RepID=UPI001043BEED|nr:TetR/AcrR family transcriptional regulator [Streptomyces sp. 8K308]TDC26318.1 TetR/AcrR family transcriptional regulator [Streptomyces sp. 8K308]